MSKLDLAVAWVVRVLFAAGWLSLVVLVAHGSVQLRCATPWAVLIRLCGFGMLTFFTSCFVAASLDESS